MERIAYSLKYKDIYNRWGLPEGPTHHLIQKAEQRLIEEIINPEPLKLPTSFRDIRTDQQYIYDLFDGQLQEELIVLWLEAQGYEAKKSGCDKDFTLFRDKVKRINSSADLTVNGKQIEIQMSRQGKRHKYHIKYHKAEHILNGRYTLLFIVGDQYLIVNSNNIDMTDVEYNFAYGGKKCVCYRPTDNDYLNIKDGVTI